MEVYRTHNLSTDIVTIRLDAIPMGREPVGTTAVYLHLFRRQDIQNTS